MLPVDLQIIKYIFFEKPMYHFKIKPFLKWNIYQSLEETLSLYEKDTRFHQKKLEELDFTIFDLETTGFFPEIGHEIISIGAIRLNGLHACRSRKFHQIIRPIRPVNNQTLRLTGLTKQQLMDASPFIEGFTNFLEFSEGSVLVAHPAKFDMRFLRAMLKRWKLPDYEPHVLDSQIMAQWLLPHVKHQLDPLLKYVGIDKRERHHALNDAIMTAELFQFLLSKALNHKIETLDDLYTVCRNQQKAKQQS
ncbi:PolC-type DNA polymerase III [Halobacillus sp. KGW1]|uniref:3'-5' exonuclease n=1 Tax=Halobacillus sp. KGW1 TaxID=1793726 RepID=UPI0007850E65|nr:exonuclease domain-containing protein [Halobacillus sp. KGW1]